MRIQLGGYFDRNFGDDVMQLITVNNMPEHDFYVCCPQREFLTHFSGCKNVHLCDSIPQTEAYVNVIGTGFKYESKLSIISKLVYMTHEDSLRGKKTAVIDCSVDKSKNVIQRMLVKRELNNTTPEILDVYSMITEAIEAGCEYFVMEVSSHSLVQKRIEGLEFTVEAFSNLTEDHLDFHKTMENYLHAKMLILDQLKGTIIVNSDDAYAKYFETKSYKTLGYSGNDYQILNYEETPKGTLITFKADKEYKVETNLKCKYNVYNYLTALGILNTLGFRIEDIINITKDINAPRGRCEQIRVRNSYAVIDYAHTPDAVEKIITSFLENKKGRIITIVGCGGDRDPLKRPIMGEIASRLSDYVIFTSDNPRTEDPNKILEDILKGVTKDNYEVEIDRPTAIRKGLDMLGDNDVLLILGKGHEDYQIIGHTKHHLDDLEEVKKYLGLI